MQRATCLSTLAPLIWVLSLAAADLALAMDRPPDPQHIRKLIEQLGSRAYGQRQYAQTELRYLGQHAIDQLIQAQYDPSPEISLAAQHVLERISVLWAKPDESEITQQILRSYDRLPLNQRAARAQWLSELEDGIGYPAVARIVRYEPSELVAKKAAVALMTVFDPHDDAQVQALHEAIDATFEKSRRQPVMWLRAFAGGLAEPGQGNVEIWRQLAEQELALDSPRTSDELTAAVFQQVARFAFRVGDEVTGRSAIQRLLALQSDAPEALVETSTWLLDIGQQRVFHDLVWGRFEQAMQDSPRFVYCAAEASLESNDERAQRLANQAFELSVNAARSDPVATSIVHFNCAFQLERRGLDDWSIREYRRLMSSQWKHWRIDFVREQATIRLSELLHDRGRDQEAAEVLSTLVDPDDRILFENSRIDGDSSGLVSRMEYFRSEHHRQRADRARQIEHLRKAAQADPTDADVLIAMYRLPRADQQWVEDTKRNLRKAASVFEAKLQRLRAAGEIENRGDVATHLNQIAWLVGNTEGDQQKAVRQSRRSLELRPRSAGSLDTLGRTYFAIGDLDQALRYQRRAARLEPHSQQIARQLKEFEQAASKDTGP